MTATEQTIVHLTYAVQIVAGLALLAALVVLVNRGIDARMRRHIDAAAAQAKRRQPSNVRVVRDQHNRTSA